MLLKNSRSANAQPLSHVEFFSKMGKFRPFPTTPVLGIFA
jgi:hypothetical protein